MSYTKIKIIRNIIQWILMIIGILLIATAFIFQRVLIYQQYGVIITGDVLIIPHWSCWFFLGFVPFLIGGFITPLSRLIRIKKDDKNDK